jgi:hypothetical protein
MQKFCHSCGKQVIVGAKFCPFCGTNLSSLTAKPTPPPVAVAQATRPGQFSPFSVGEKDEDDSYIDGLQHLDIRLSSLDVEIVRDRPLGETVGALVSQAMHSSGPPEQAQARPAQYSSQEAFMQDFRKEAGTMRQNEK